MSKNVPTSSQVIIPPTRQLEFLINIQRLLSEGQFTATYKYALLLAIADICVEDGNDSGNAFKICTEKIAEKFISYYWPQVRPYRGSELHQNKGGTLAVINALRNAGAPSTVKLIEMKRDMVLWPRLVSRVHGVIRKMPLWRLQVVSGHLLEVLYKNREKGNYIQLKTGSDVLLSSFPRICYRFCARSVGPLRAPF